MFRRVTVLLSSVLWVVPAGAQPVSNGRFVIPDEVRLAPRALFVMSTAEIDTLIREVAARETSLTQRLAFFSERAKGTPYALFCLGEGPDAKYDRDPLIDFTRADCVTFTEQMLALAISRNYVEMFHNLQRIRYRNGEIDLRRRNHFTHADWVPNNAWLLHDVTAAVGGKYCRTMTKTINRRQLLRHLGVPDSELVDVPPPETMTIKYVPEQYLLAIQDSLRTGDIFSIIQKAPGIFSAHVGFLIRTDHGGLVARHASSRPRNRQVVDEPFAAMVQQLKANRKRVGMAFLRVHSGLQFVEPPATAVEKDESQP
ncbi:MAG: DUF1460 domain-containing protein [candidate division KSB1 bacterium]|nr:DUF1460 domain-containing protein [candidate division KSB1 bacterium]MDZ7274658.1 DUF1460 domain-containing protein [candidate division KSB1 bacterium]MDZ7285483.1 DUF1460 domain-containing protein [candidate division KSB1 bacterium]MDZ7298515.1 DUF1460 domain-containing protein [candidate division KSB1 bacterium]MDZ7306261.1 DUF1460 domain-containing protein [candidate division KSB1 bacterium]